MQLEWQKYLLLNGKNPTYGNYSSAQKCCIDGHKSSLNAVSCDVGIREGNPLKSELSACSALALGVG